MLVFYDERSFQMVGSRQEFESSVGLEVVVRFNDVLVEGEAGLARTGGIRWLSGPYIVLRGATQKENMDEQ